MQLHPSSLHRLAVSFLCGLGLAACGNEAASRVTLNLTGLAPLENGAHYEGWVVGRTQVVSSGKFNVRPDGTIVSHPGGVPNPSRTFLLGQFVSKSATLVISVEPANDADDVPAVTKVLAGDVNAQGAAAMSIVHPKALGTDFLAAMGTFDLVTPTDDDPNNDTSGLWFIKRTPQGVEPSLSIPPLPEGWVYEGWAVVNAGMPDETPLSTGKFRLPVGRDAASAFSGAKPGPEFPGEDFVSRLPATVGTVDITKQARVVISVEPDPDDAPTPSRMKPLVQAAPDKSRTLVNEATTTAPSGMAVLD